jgi:hypothetical protein
VRMVGRSCLLIGVGLILAACILLLWPLHANGVSGSDLRPHYSRYFGFNTSVLLPSNPTHDDLRRAGVRLPVDVVWHRRHIAEAMAGSGGLVLLIATWPVTTSATRRRRSQLSVEEEQSG